MDYHKDRFEDFSLMVFKKNMLIAVLPANKVDNDMYSHQGLSYGGLLVLDDIRILDYKNIFQCVLESLDEFSIKNLYIKKLPFIYHKTLSGELDYILSRLKSEIVTTDSYFVLDNQKDYQPNRNRKRAIIKANQDGLEISDESIDFFWHSILTKNLKSKFDVNPVHSLQEIKYLISKFPNNIKYYTVKIAGVVKAGAIVFVTDQVAHIQYSSGSEDRNESSALDFLFHKIIEFYREKKYLSFGSSSTDASLKINLGLAYWKESFGATTISQEIVMVEIKNKNLLNSMFI